MTGWPLFLPMAMTAGYALAIRIDNIRINLLIVIYRAVITWSGKKKLLKSKER